MPLVLVAFRHWSLDDGSICVRWKDATSGLALGRFTFGGYALVV